MCSCIEICPYYHNGYLIFHCLSANTGMFCKQATFSQTFTSEHMNILYVMRAAGFSADIKLFG